MSINNFVGQNDLEETFLDVRRFFDESYKQPVFFILHTTKNIKLMQIYFKIKSAQSKIYKHHGCSKQFDIKCKV